MPSNQTNYKIWKHPSRLKAAGGQEVHQETHNSKGSGNNEIKTPPLFYIDKWAWKAK